MKTTNALVAAALAGVFAAGTTVTHASPMTGAPVSAEDKDKCPGKEKDKCPDKDKEKCPGKEKEKEKKEGEIL